MLSPLRRSIDQRLVRCTCHCVRRIHSQNLVRAAAEAQLNVDISTLQPPNISKSQQNRGSQLQQPLPHPTQPSNKKSKDISATKVSPSPQKSGKKSSLKADSTRGFISKDLDVPVETKRNESTSLNSPYYWDRDSIIEVYGLPGENELPLKTINGETFDWKKSPDRYLLQFLKLEYKVNSMSTFLEAKGGQRIQQSRNKISVSWGNETYSAVGDGPNKVISLDCH
jgi:hypothetical protein